MPNNDQALPRRVTLERTRFGRAPTIVNPALAAAMAEVWRDDPDAQLSDGGQYDTRQAAQKVAGRYKSWLAKKHNTHVSSLTGEDPEQEGAYIFTLSPAEA